MMNIIDIILGGIGLVVSAVIIGMYFCYIDYGNLDPFRRLWKRIRGKRK